MYSFTRILTCETGRQTGSPDKRTDGGGTQSQNNNNNNNNMKRIKENSAFLKATVAAHPQQCKALILTAKQSQLDAICEILYNILRGVIKLKEALLKKASRYKRILRELVTKCGANKKYRREQMVKYYSILQKLIGAALPVLGFVLSVAQIASG